MNAVIYDFETLGQDQAKSAVVSFAMLEFSIPRLMSDVPYKFEQLVDSAHVIKFDVAEQLEKYSRTISKDTLKWWTEHSSEKARNQLKPSPEDRSISELYDFIDQRINLKNVTRTFTRGNTFDPMFLQYLMEQCGKPMPFHWRSIRDTRSMIEGMSIGMDLDNAYIPSDLEHKFIKHDPVHDIAMDVMRMQYLAQAILC